MLVFEWCHVTRIAFSELTQRKNTYQNEVRVIL
jgi:hypothetical protein